MTLAVLKSRALTGMTAPEVTVEVHLANGLPAFTIVADNSPAYLHQYNQSHIGLQLSCAYIIFLEFAVGSCVMDPVKPFFIQWKL